MYQQQQYGRTSTMPSEEHKSCTSLVSKDSIKRLPPEVMYLIIERMDPDTYVNCLHVSKQWRSIALSIANNDKKDQWWRIIFELYHENESFKLKSNPLLSYKDLFKNSLLWNYESTFYLSANCLVDRIEKINIYRDNIIVINFEGVKYFDLKTLKIKRKLRIHRCCDFIERDDFFLRSTKMQREEISVYLMLYGKSHPDDNGFMSRFEIQMALNSLDGRFNRGVSVLFRGVNYYMIEKNCCYVLNYRNILTCYTLSAKQTWDSRMLGRFYGNRDDLTYAMTVLNSEVYVLNKWGRLMYYCHEKRNFQETNSIRMAPSHFRCIKIVHKYCVVIEVPWTDEFRITRYRNNKGYNFYKFECPNLSCVTEHGEMLFLGFNDGRIEIYTPRANSREDIFKSSINITDFQEGYIESQDLIIISIDVYEDFGQHYIFIATPFVLYQLTVTNPDGISVWDNIPERVTYYKHPIRTRCVL